MTTTNELADRVFGGILGTYDTWAIYVSDDPIPNAQGVDLALNRLVERRHEHALVVTRDTKSPGSRRVPPGHDQ